MKQLISAGLLLVFCSSSAACDLSKYAIYQLMKDKLITLKFDANKKLVEASCDMTRMTNDECEHTIEHIFEFYQDNNR